MLENTWKMHFNQVVINVMIDDQKKKLKKILVHFLKITHQITTFMLKGAMPNHYNQITVYGSIGLFNAKMLYICNGKLHCHCVYTMAHSYVQIIYTYTYTYVHRATRTSTTLWHLQKETKQQTRNIYIYVYKYTHIYSALITYICISDSIKKVQYKTDREKKKQIF